VIALTLRPISTSAEPSFACVQGGVYRSTGTGAAGCSARSATGSMIVANSHPVAFRI
jgi:hypothetical protein